MVKIGRTFFLKSGSDSSSWGLWIVGLAFLLVGLGSLNICFGLYQTEVEFNKMSVSASGAVIDLIRKDGYGSSKETYSPVVQFIDQQGKTQILRSSVSANPPAYHQGEQVRVLYYPYNPETAVIDGWQHYIFIAILSGMGIIFSLVGLLVIGAAITTRLKAKKS